MVVVFLGHSVDFGDRPLSLKYSLNWKAPRFFRLYHSLLDSLSIALLPKYKILVRVIF